MMGLEMGTVGLIFFAGLIVGFIVGLMLGFLAGLINWQVEEAIR